MSEPEFQKALRSILDGESDDLRDVEIFLSEDESNLTEYLEQVELDALLRWELGEENGVTIRPDFVDSPGRKEPWTAAVRPLFQIAALLTVGVIAFLFGKNRTVSDSSSHSTAPVAVLIDSEDCVWKSGPKTRSFGAPFEAGETLRIGSGVARLALWNKAGVAISGPAEVDLISSDEVLVHHGSVSAFAPEEAIGFTVTTPDVEIVDLGTRFATSVAKDGTTDVHVFEGEISVQSRASLQKGELVTTGQARRYSSSGDKPTEIAIAPEQFDDPPELEQLLAVTGSQNDESAPNALRDLVIEPGVIAAQHFLAGSGELDGQFGGAGFGSHPWRASPELTRLIPRIQSHAGEFSAGGHLLVRGRDKTEPFIVNRIGRQLKDVLPKEYFFAVRASYHGLDEDDFFALWTDANSSEGSSHADVPSIGIREGRFFARLDIETAAVGEVAQDNEDFVIAARYVRDAEKGVERIYLWVNPDEVGNQLPDAETLRPRVKKSNKDSRFLKLRMGKYTEVGDRLLIRSFAIATDLQSALKAIR